MCSFINIVASRDAATSTRSMIERNHSMSTYTKNNPPVGYYVYAYVRKSDATPYYIGKGKGARAWCIHNGITVPQNSKIIILEQNLTDIGALALERRMIRWWGRKDLQTGILLNQTDGGDGSEGRIANHQTKEKISLAKAGKKRADRVWNKGLKYSQEIKSKLDYSGLSLGQGWNKGKTLTDDHKANLKKAWERRRALAK